MRQIEFRAWDKMENKMVKVLGISKNENSDLWFIDYDNDDGSRLMMDPQECELMQFTGLLDKHGKKIFEGDIVTGFDTWGDPLKAEVKIIARDGLVQCVPFAHTSENESGFYSENCEIIGNIYEHPNLLSQPSARGE